MEKELVNLLCKLSAQHYLPILAHHRVTTEALRNMNSSDLKKVCLQHPYKNLSIYKCISISYRFNILHARFHLQLSDL